MFTRKEKDRYSRQISLLDFGPEGQKKLKHSSVLVVGAGGLGCPVLTYLAAAGVGHLGIVDFDVVELSNLHRQLLYNESDLGKKKVSAAASQLRKINSDIKISEFDCKLETGNVLQVFQDFNIIVDGTDNLTARYIINDACALLGKPWVYGSIYKFEGQVSLFHKSGITGSSGHDYRSLFPEPPPHSSMATCNEAGVIGVLPGTIGMLQATEAIKYLCGIGSNLSGRLIIYDALEMTIDTFVIDHAENENSSAPKTVDEFLGMDYSTYCNSGNSGIKELEPNELESFIEQHRVSIFDIREVFEETTFNSITSIHMPLSRMKLEESNFEMDIVNIFVCHRGISSRSLVEKLLLNNVTGNFYSLKYGVEGWKSYLQNKVNFEHGMMHQDIYK